MHDTQLKDYVSEALEHVGNPDKEELPLLKLRLNELKTRRSNCLAVEEALITRLNVEISSTRSQINLLESGICYSPIDLSIPLSWVDSTKEHMPRLAVFRLDKPHLTFKWGREWDWTVVPFVVSIISLVLSILVSIVDENGVYFLYGLGAVGLSFPIAKSIGLYVDYRRNRIEPKLPKVIQNHYDYVRGNLTKGNLDDWGRNVKYRSIERTTYFKGGIPDKVKEEISKARKSFGEDIYLVANAEGWKKKDKAIPPRNVDPLVIGVKGDHTYLITAFDMTPLEEAVKTEFTS